MSWSTRVTLLGVCSLVTPTVAHAQTSAETNAAQGEVLFERAYEAYSNGNFHQAAPLFERAAAYFPQCPTSTVLRGKSLEQIGRLGEAHEAYASVNPIPTIPDEAPPCAEARREAQARTKSLEKHVGWMRLEVSPSNPAQVWLTLPNAAGPAANRERYARTLPAPTATSGGPTPTRVWEHLAMTAGSVVVAIDTDGTTAQTITVTARATTTVVFAPPASALPSDTAPAPSDATPTSTPDPNGRTAYGEPWMWVGGAGIASVLLGTITGLVASNKTDDVRAHCDSAAQLCTPAGISARDSAETFGWVSNISLGVGVAGVIVAGVLYLNGAADAPHPAQVGSVELRPGLATSSGAEGATLSVAW
jgi:hypothetical protein